MKILMLIFVMLLIAPAVAADPHCIAKDDDAGTFITQCDDGTVTFVQSNGGAVVCHPAPVSGEPICKTIKGQ